MPDIKKIRQVAKMRGYALAEVDETHNTIKLQCPLGHIWNTTWAGFRDGANCLHCYHKIWTFDKIKQEVGEEKFELLSTTYINCKRPLKFRCPKGHLFSKTWNNFYHKKQRCPACYQQGRRPDILQIEKYFEQQGYVLVSSQYKHCKEKMQTICPNGHKWAVSWSGFKQGHRCRHCAIENKYNTLEYIREHVEQQGYSVLSDRYEGVKEKILLQCNNGHKYLTCWNDFQQGHRCPQCFKKRSKAERQVVDLYSGLALIENDRTILNSKELDLYFPDHKVAIEYCGLYWHGDQHERITPSYHRDKLDQCNQQGIRLLTIFEDEWLNHKDICISRINNALGICPTRIPARKCEAREISKKEAKEFLNRTHLQGYGRCKIPFGLYYKGKLVQVMTWGSPARAHTAKGKKVLEMKRLAGELNTVIIGGASKLFKLGLQYAKDNGYDSLKSYCDLRWGTGNLYKKLGFSKTYETRYTPHYTDGVNRYRNQVLAQNKNKTGKTEAEVAQEKGLWKIYDCGHSTWEYEVQNGFN